MSTYTTLADLPPGKSGKVKSLTTTGAMRRRLLDIGLAPGAKVDCIGAAPFGDPRCYMICGAVIAIRQKDSKTVFLCENQAKWG